MSATARLRALSPGQWLAILVVAVTAIRLCAAAAVPLTEDEAYYRLWAAEPQFGYYDHPPMIAWWIWSGVRLLGDDRLGIRLAPCLSAGVVTALTFDIARRVGAGAWMAFRAALWYNGAVLIGVGGFLAVPDAPNMLFWALTLSCLARTDRRTGWAWWIGAGAAAGLACLSKYSALFLAPGAVLWLLVRRDGRREFLKPWPWVCALVAAGLFAVNVVWNAQHHWQTFIKQFGRVAPSAFAPQFLVELIVGQALLLTPFIAFFAIRGAIRTVRQGSKAIDVGLVFWTAVPFAAYLVLHSLHDRVQAHWPFPLYSGLAVLGAVAADSAPAEGWIQWMRRRADRLGPAVSLVVLLHMSWSATDFTPYDPVVSLRGWPAFAAQVERLRVQAGAGWVGTLSYGSVAELAASHAIHAPIVEIRERDRYPPADPSWRADLSRPGLIVDIDRRALSADLSACFASVRPIGGLVRGSGATEALRYAAFVVTGPRPGLLTGGCGQLETSGVARQRVW